MGHTPKGSRATQLNKVWHKIAAGYSSHRFCATARNTKLVANRWNKTAEKRSRIPARIKDGVTAANCSSTKSSWSAGRKAAKVS